MTLAQACLASLVALIACNQPLAEEIASSDTLRAMLAPGACFATGSPDGDPAKVGSDVRIAGTELLGAMKEFVGFVESIGLRGQDAEQIVRIRLIGLLRSDAAIGRFSFAQPPGPVVGQCLLEIGVQGRSPGAVATAPSSQLANPSSGAGSSNSMSLRAAMRPMISSRQRGSVPSRAAIVT